MKRAPILSTFLVALALAACTGDDRPPAGTPGSRSTPFSQYAADRTLQPASEVRSATAAAAPVLQVGEAGEMQEYRLAVLAVEPRSVEQEGGRFPEEAGAWLLATVRVENRGSEESGLQVDWELHCGGEVAGYVYLDERDSQIPLAIDGGTPPGTFDEGTVLLSLPADCPGAQVVATPTGVILDGVQPVRWAVP